MKNYQTGSDTSLSAQIVIGPSEIQSCFKHFEIFNERPLRPQIDPLGAKTQNSFVVVVVSFSFYRLRAGKEQIRNNGKKLNS